MRTAVDNVSLGWMLLFSVGPLQTKQREIKPQFVSVLFVFLTNSFGRFNNNKTWFSAYLIKLPNLIVGVYLSFSFSFEKSWLQLTKSLFSQVMPEGLTIWPKMVDRICFWSRQNILIILTFWWSSLNLFILCTFLCMYVTDETVTSR